MSDDEADETTPQPEETTPEPDDTTQVDDSAANADKSGFSDSDEESETFDPMPYAFILKDAYRNPLILSPERVSNACVICPSFHLLLDHTVAVLWCFYSETGHHKLGTSQLHWAIKFLEGLVDQRNRCTPDVAMAINHLEDALVQAASALDDKEVANRTYQDEKPLHYSMILRDGENVPPVDDYLSFAKDLLERNAKSNLESSALSGMECSEEDRQKREELSIFEKSRKNIVETLQNSQKTQRLKTPSIILNNMLEKKPDVLKAIIENAVQDLEREEILSSRISGDSFQSSSVRGIQSETEAAAAADAAIVRNNLIRRAIGQLEQIKDLLGNLDNMNTNPTPEEISKLKDMLYNL